MRLLIAEDKSRASGLEDFVIELEKLGIQCKLVGDLEMFHGKTGNKYFKWFKSSSEFDELIADFDPDVVLVERFTQFAHLSMKAGIPLMFFLLGDYWTEAEWSKKNSTIKERLNISAKKKMVENCFKKSIMILPICKYLENIVLEKYPEKKTHVLYQGINVKEWEECKGMKLEHPCVGLLQGATIWGKTKEMQILPKVLEALPHVKFYWAGSGQFTDKILQDLEKFENFKWLGSLDYPKQVKEFLSEIDIFLHVSGQDMSPHTLLEAGLMKKPIISTSVGGIPESIDDGITGFLVQQGNPNMIIDKLSSILNDKIKSKEMGEKSQNFVKNKFAWEKIAKEFSSVLKEL